MTELINLAEERAKHFNQRLNKKHEQGYLHLLLKMILTASHKSLEKKHIREEHIDQMKKLKEKQEQDNLGESAFFSLSDVSTFFIWAITQ